MKSERTKKDRLRADVLLIAALLVVALGFFAVRRLSRKDGALAVVYVNGERTAEYPLSEDAAVTLHAPNGGYNILVISGGTAAGYNILLRSTRATRSCVSQTKRRSASRVRPLPMSIW